MTLGDLGKKLAGKGLKLLGGAIPGGGIVMDMVSSALDTDPTPEAVAKAIDENPDAALKLTEIQTRHKEVLEGIALERARLEIEGERDRLADVQSARNMNIAGMQATGKRDINLYVLAWTVIVGFFALMTLLIFRPLPSGAEG